MSAQTLSYPRIQGYVQSFHETVTIVEWQAKHLESIGDTKNANKIRESASLIAKSTLRNQS